MNKEREQQAQLVNEQIFSVLNDYDHKFDFIDLHGQLKEFSIKTTLHRLKEIEHEIESKMCQLGCDEGRTKPEKQVLISDLSVLAES